jgi:predicted DNA binding protein
MERLRNVFSSFDLPGHSCIVSIHEINIGHIHFTYHIICSDQSAYVLQQINSSIFQDPINLMKNMEKICHHLHMKSIPTLTFIPTKVISVDSAPSYCHLDDAGRYWRLCCYVDNSRVVDDIPTISDIITAANAFGNFQYSLLDLSPSSLCTIIPDFHNTRLRYEKFLEAVREDPFLRISDYSLASDIDQICSRADRLVDLIASLHDDVHRVPYRLVHNDTKLNNVLLDQTRNQSICVIDLDTVMTGSLLSDFGDMVRGSCSTAAEDECDVESVALDLSKFKAIAEGYLRSDICRRLSSSLGGEGEREADDGLLTDIERAHLVEAAQVIGLPPPFPHLS